MRKGSYGRPSRHGVGHGTALEERRDAPAAVLGPVGPEPWMAWEMVALVLLSIVAAGLRLYRLDALGLWEDEGWTAYVAPQKLPAILQWCRGDTAPPLYYFLIHFWLPVMGGEFGLRLPSALFGVLAIPLAYLCGRSAYGPRAGLFAALLLTANAFHVRYSQEARFYALYLAASLASIYFTLELGRRPRRGLWAGWVCATTVMLYTHCTAAVYVLALSALLWALRPDRRAAIWGGWLRAHAVLALLFLPWGYAFARQASRVIGKYWPPAPTAGGVAETALHLFSIPFALDSSAAGLAWLPVLLAMSFAAFLVWALAARRGIRVGPAPVGLVLFGLGAWGIIFGFSVAVRSVYITRIFIPTLGALLTAAAVVLASSWHGSRGRAAGALLVMMLASEAVSLGIYYRSFRKQEVRQAVAHVFAHGRRGDAVALVQQRLRPAVYHYLDTLKKGVQPAALSVVPIDLSRFTHPGSDTRGVTPERAAADLSRASSLWLIEVDHPSSAALNHQTEAWLQTFLRPVETHAFYEVRLLRYIPRGRQSAE